MTARELAAILLRHPDLPVRVVNDDYSHSEVTSATLIRERYSVASQDTRPAAIDLMISAPDWQD